MPPFCNACCGVRFRAQWSVVSRMVLCMGRYISFSVITWWRNKMQAFSALLAICAGNSPVTGEFPTQRPMTQGLGVFFDVRLNKLLSEQWWGWWFETPPRPLSRHCNNVILTPAVVYCFMKCCGIKWQYIPSIHIRTISYAMPGIFATVLS